VGVEAGAWPVPDAQPWLSDRELVAFGLPGARAQAAHALSFLAEIVAARRCVLVARHPLEDAALAGVVWAAPALPSPALPSPSPALPSPAETLGVFMPTGGQWPSHWSASFIENLRACPYRAYGERVLNLRALDPLDEDLDPRAAGQMVHAWLQHIGSEFPCLTAAEIPAAVVRMQAVAERLLAEAPPLVAGLWHGRLARLAPLLAERWVSQGRSVVALEHRVEKVVGAVTVTAKIDRVEGLIGQDSAADGPVVIVDFKTGRAPEWTMVARGDKPQLALEAWLWGTAAATLEYWVLKGFGAHRLEVENKAAAAYVAPVEDGVRRLVEAFGEGRPFMALPEEATCEYCPLAGVCRRAAVAAVLTAEEEEAL
jgi:RecB family exonuclease